VLVATRPAQRRRNGKRAQATIAVAQRSAVQRSEEAGVRRLVRTVLGGHRGEIERHNLTNCIDKCRRRRHALPPVPAGSDSDS
jgi:hypothetical protein